MPTYDERRTPRLLLKRMRRDDLDDLTRMHQDPVVMATLAGVRSREETRAGLERHLAHWEQHGFGWWVLRDPQTGQFIGRGGLRHVVFEGTPGVEVGYGLMSEFWGRGLATELAREAVRVAFAEMGLPELICFTLPTNRPSQRVMEKAGFRYERDGVYAELPHVFYRLTAAQWRAAHG
jgi:ribosomal-protein-alanine N-acetyltransferase